AAGEAAGEHELVDASRVGGGIANGDGPAGRSGVQGEALQVQVSDESLEVCQAGGEGEVGDGSVGETGAALVVADDAPMPADALQGRTEPGPAQLQVAYPPRDEHERLALPGRRIGDAGAIRCGEEAQLLVHAGQDKTSPGYCHPPRSRREGSPWGRRRRWRRDAWDQPRPLSLVQKYRYASGTLIRGCGWNSTIFDETPEVLGVQHPAGRGCRGKASPCRGSQGVSPLRSRQQAGPHYEKDERDKRTILNRAASDTRFARRLASGGHGLVMARGDAASR